EPGARPSGLGPNRREAPHLARQPEAHAAFVGSCRCHQACSTKHTGKNGNEGAATMTLLAGGHTALRWGYAQYLSRVDEVRALQHRLVRLEHGRVLVGSPEYLFTTV